MVQGLAEMNRRWGAIPAKVRAAARDALEDVATDLVNQMRAVAPRQTGELAASINWTWGDAPGGAMVIGTVAGRDYATMRITIYAGGPGAEVYNSRGQAFDLARIMEFGTKTRAANPFFYPVWRTRRRGAKSKITRAISKAIRG